MAVKIGSPAGTVPAIPRFGRNRLGEVALLEPKPAASLRRFPPSGVHKSQPSSPRSLICVPKMLFEVLLRRRPYTETDAMQLVFAKLDPNRDPHLDAPELAAFGPLGDVVRKAMGWAANDRYLSATVFRQALAGAVDQLGPQLRWTAAAEALAAAKQLGIAPQSRIRVWLGFGAQDWLVLVQVEVCVGYPLSGRIHTAWVLQPTRSSTRLVPPVPTATASRRTAACWPKPMLSSASTR